MNEQIKELAFEAGFTITPCGLFEAEDTNLERFAELVRADEREACASLVEADGRVHPKAPDAVWAKTIAKLIRARGTK